MDNRNDALKDAAISELSDYLEALDPKHRDILSYWLRDYVRFLKKERTFNPKKVIRYKRGTIIKAHLGYRIGSEEGGLHYGIVIDKQNTLSSSTVTIIPLTSIKPNTDIANLHPSKIYLGDEIYQKMLQKVNDALDDIEVIQNKLSAKLDELEAQKIDLQAPDAKTQLAERRVSIDLLKKEMEAWNQKLENAKKLEREFSKMKCGSIALVNQLTTISKIRIYDPLFPTDTLSGIRISDDALNKIDDKITEFFIGRT